MNRNVLFPLLILLAGGLFFFPFLGKVHLFDWDEINFAESAREMIVTGNYTQVQIDFQPFWEKPPLFFWLQVLSMKLFGINEFAARFPNAVSGIVTLLCLYFIGEKLYNAIFGFLWSLVYLGSFLPFFYFKSGIIDPIFNLFIFLSTYFLIQAIHFYKEKRASRYTLLSGIFIGLAILTKGPVGLLILLLTFLTFWISKRFRPVISFKNLLLFGLSAFIVSTAWFGLEVLQHGFWFLQRFITYQAELFSRPVAGHQQPFYYHFVVLLFGCFPLSVFALFSLFQKNRDHTPYLQRFRQWMIILFLVVLILFTIVTTKIVHYSSMAYFPLSFLAAQYIYQLYTRRATWNKWNTITLLFFGFVLSFSLAVFPLILMNKQILVRYIRDKFAVAYLQAPVVWSGWEGLIGIFYFLAILFALFQYKKRNTLAATSLLFLFAAASMFLYTALVIPKIELYTQAAAIRFYQSLKGQHVYVHPVGFKSYAHLFYFDKQPANNINSTHEEWLLNGAIDRPVYFVTKITHKYRLEGNPQVKFIKEENGFVFWRRDPL
ncbi:MAG: glycosyltransferase family 39 protein [Flavisolibacter sp.]|nr:glycosyltransferase family 39 protein [Flavisolibacter sp.]